MRKSKKNLTATPQAGVAPVAAVTTTAPTASLTPLEFTLKAIPRLRALKPYKNPKTGELAKGIHSVITGFNAAFRKQFPNLDPVAEQKKMVESGHIETQYSRGGVMLYLKGEKPKREQSDKVAADALAAILA